jgi:hypothetical protein
MLKDTPLIQEILAEQRRDLVQEVILRSLEMKFGPAPPGMAIRVRSVQEVPRLLDLAVEIAVCPDLDAFRALLPS